MFKSTLVIVSILVSTISFTQETSIGIFGGMNSSSINGTYNAHGYQSTQIKNLKCAQFGILVSYSLSDKLSLFSNLGYFAKGFKYQQDEEMVGSASFNGTNEFKYINIPLTLKLGLFKNNLFYIRSGFYMSFLLSGKIEDKISYPYPDMPTESTDEKITEDLNKSVYGFVSGVGFDIPLSKKINLLVDVSYQIDISNALKNKPPVFWGYKDGIYTTVSEVKNRSVLISMGVVYKVE